MTTLPDKVANQILEMVEDARALGVWHVDSIIAEVHECWEESLRDEKKRMRVEQWKSTAK